MRASEHVVGGMLVHLLLLTVQTLFLSELSIAHGVPCNSSHPYTPFLCSDCDTSIEAHAVSVLLPLLYDKSGKCCHCEVPTCDHKDAQDGRLADMH